MEGANAKLARKKLPAQQATRRASVAIWPRTVEGEGQEVDEEALQLYLEDLAVLEDAEEGGQEEEEQDNEEQ